MTIKQIHALKPEFKFNGITMIDWFEVTQGSAWCSIRNGLRHADGKTKSPYYYEHALGGKDAVRQCLKNFTTWWNTKKS